MTDQRTNPPTSIARPATRTHTYLTALGAVLALCLLVGGGYLTLLDKTAPPIVPAPCGDGGEEQMLQSGDQPSHDYRKWDRPDLALVISGQMHGYIDPCGCSDPQYGGLERRYNFVQSLRAGFDMKKGWDVVGIDLGEFAQLQGIHAQNLLKFDLTMKALALTNYRAVGLGKHEVLAPVGDALAQAWDKKRPMPRPISLSLEEAWPGGNLHELNARPYEIIDHTSPKIGVISLIGPDLRVEIGKQQLGKQAVFAHNQDKLSLALKAFADASVEVGIILHHEYPEVDKKLQGFKRMEEVEKERAKQALKCAKFCADERKKNPKIPPIDFMVILNEQPEPPFQMSQLDPNLPTRVIEIGHKGKYLGLVGLYREAKGYRVQYQAVQMGPEWKTPREHQAKHPIIALVENYNQELRRHDMLAKFPRSRHINQIPAANQNGLRATFVGSARCGDCHPAAYDVWEKSSHFKATVTLEDPKQERRPSGRHFDPECMKCHTTGMAYPGGYNDPVTKLADWPESVKVDAKKLQKHNDSLRGVGCESCHGPGSEHVKDPNNKDLYRLINPYGASAELRDLSALARKNPAQTQRHNMLLAGQMRALGTFCMNCHNEENDVNWGKPGHDTIDLWKLIAHPTKKLVNGAVAPPANVPIPPPPFTIEVFDEKKK